MGVRKKRLIVGASDREMLLVLKDKVRVREKEI